MRKILTVLILAAGLAGCGGDGPTDPGPTTTSVAVTLKDVVLVGTTAQASATATMSNGQVQPVTSGFRSDATGVATVTGAGLVTGVANGSATIIATSNGRDGAKRIRVAPNYDGRWQGLQTLTACNATGDFGGICDEEDGIIGAQFLIDLTARHPGELSVSGEFSLEGLQFPTFTAPVEEDGTLRFSSTTVVDGIRAEVSWQMNSNQDGRASGTIREKYSVPGVLAGEVSLDSTFSEFARSLALEGAGRIGLKDVRRRILRIRR